VTENGTSSSAPEQARESILAEAERLLKIAEASSVPLRLLGGVAIRLRSPAGLPPALERSYQDLDFMAAKGSTEGVKRMFTDAGYESSEPFNAIRGRKRMLFFDTRLERQVDVFIGRFEMCHSISIDDRLQVEPISIPLAELLLTKLQIVELNEKDVRDVLGLLYGHRVTVDDGVGVNKSVVASRCAGDWGLWRTCWASLNTCRDRVGDYDLPDAAGDRIRAALTELLDALDQAPKSRQWKLRAKIGDRLRWYELPEEVHSGAATT
jgi:hypothetical protein